MKKSFFNPETRKRIASVFKEEPLSFPYTAPDIANERLKKSSLPIDFVGIRNLEMPVCLKEGLHQVPAVIDIFVSLDDPKARGIHMSRIYRSLHDFFEKETLSFSAMEKVLKEIIGRQEKISHSGRLKISAKWPKNTKALKSALSGWRYHPFFYQTEFQEKQNITDYILGGEVLYSSTCPCSASLSREVIQQEFQVDFSGDNEKDFTREKVSEWLKTGKSQSATPHAQKSRAVFKILVSEQEKDQVSILNIIEEVEQTLGTPVQTAVKRADEMEFARLNGRNMLFCEDAVRRIGELFKSKKHFLDYHVQVRHYESLHPFTVESSLVKGVTGGWSA